MKRGITLAPPQPPPPPKKRGGGEEEKKQTYVSGDESEGKIVKHRPTQSQFKFKPQGFSSPWNSPPVIMDVVQYVSIFTVSDLKVVLRQTLA